MNKTLNINLAGFIFHIDDNAYLRLDIYLDTLKKQFVSTEGGTEIINDIEIRIAELFKERTGPAREVINLADVEEVIAIMGQPEDYLDGEETPPPPPPRSEYTSTKKRIFRDNDNRIIGGVAAGLAAYFNIDAIWMRIVFLLMFFSGFGFILYLILWLVMPKAQTTAEKLQMRGEKVNISNIERSIREEMSGINENVKNFGKKVSDYDYRKSSGQLTNFINEVGNFLLEALRLIFKLIGKIIGLFFLFLGFMVLLALAIGLFAGSVEIMGAGYGFNDLFDFLYLVSENDSHYNLLIAAIVLTTIAPLFLLLYFGLRILFNLEPLNKPTKNALSVTTIIGIVLMITAGVKIGLQFDDHSRVTDEIDLTNNNDYYIRIQKDSLWERYTAGTEQTQWMNFDDVNAFGHINLNIKKAEGEVPYIKIITEAQGQNRREAQINARQVQFELNLKDSLIEIPFYYLLEKNHKYRGQQIEVILFLPEDHSIFIDESLTEVLYNVDNVQNEWDFNMVDKRWIMTGAGLNCEGCEIPERLQNDSIHLEINEIKNDTGDPDLQIKIEEDGDEKSLKVEFANDNGSADDRNILLLNKRIPLVI